MKNQICLGTEAFVDKMQSKISFTTNLSEAPAAQKRQVPRELDAINQNILIATWQLLRLMQVVALA